MASEHPDTQAVSAEREAEVAVGPHSHWSSFDLKFEGARYHALHEIVSAPAFNAVAANETALQIFAFARGWGDAEASTYLNEYGNKSPDEIEEDSLASIRHDDLFHSYDETEYFECVSKSARLISEASATPEAKAFVNSLVVDALDAFCAGRDSHIERSNPSTSAAP